MRNHVWRLAVPLATLAVGIAVGWAASQATHDGSGVAQAAKAEKAVGENAGAAQRDNLKRFGAVIGLKRETMDKYVDVHKKVWPGVLKRIHDSNIRNYSIYLGELDDGNLYLFAYYEYVGDDYQADMKAMAADKTTKEWWKVTDPLQIPQKNRKPGEHWMTMEEVFHTD